jgi:hypothetical protein
VPGVKEKPANFYQRAHKVEFSVCPRLKYSIATPIIFYFITRARAETRVFLQGNAKERRRKV